MTPAAIYTLVKDGVIVGLVLWLLWMVYSSGQNSVTVKQFDALKESIAQNAKQEKDWHAQGAKVDAQTSADIADLHTTIGNQHAPVFVCKSPSGGKLPGDTGSSSSVNPSQGGTDEGRGRSSETVVDIRPQVNKLEEKYEDAFAQCRGILAKWPKKTFK